MTDYIIKDFQISASSEVPDYTAVKSRPSESGWCANHSDTQPYLQVLTLTP